MDVVRGSGLRMISHVKSFFFFLLAGGILAGISGLHRTPMLLLPLLFFDSSLPRGNLHMIP